MSDDGIWVDAERVRIILREKGMNVGTLADAIGMKRSGVQRILREETTSLATIARMCDALGCGPLDVIVWDKHFPPPKSQALAFLSSSLQGVMLPEYQ